MMVWEQSFNASLKSSNTYKLSLFMLCVKITGEKKTNPSLNPDTTRSQPFLLCSSRSVFMRQSVTQHLCSSSSRAPLLTGVTRLPSPSVWHLPGDGKWRFQSHVKICCRCTGPRCVQRRFSTPWLPPSPAEPHELWAMSRWVRAPPRAPRGCSMPLIHTAYRNSTVQGLIWKEEGFAAKNF